MRKWLAISLATALSFAIPALAGLVTGNELYKWLLAGKKLTNTQRAYGKWESDLEKSGIAEGYIMGIVDGAQGRLFCIPARVTIGQLMDITLQYLETHPETRHHSGNLLVTASFAGKYPCENKR